MKKIALAILMAFSLTACANQEETGNEVRVQISQPEEKSSVSMEEKTLPNLSTEQTKLLKLAFLIAERDGHKEPKLLQGLLMQETRAGADISYKKPINGCYGILQLKMIAAQDVLKRYPELASRFSLNPKNESAIRNKLIHDDEFNLIIGSRYLMILNSYGFNTIKQLALAWNQGAGGAKRVNAESFPYVKGVMLHVQKLTKPPS